MQPLMGKDLRGAWKRMAKATVAIKEKQKICPQFISIMQHPITPSPS